MNRIPFSVYDFFAYLTSGSIVVAALDYLYGKQWLLEKDHTAIFSLFLIFWVYIAGHIVANFSAPIIEHFFVGHILLRPSETLMGKKRPILPFIFRLYYTPLRKETRNRISVQSKSRIFEGSGEALFAHIFGILKHDEVTLERLNSFRNQYGFSRNLAFAFFVIGVLFLFGPIDGRQIPSDILALGSFFCSITMLYRYLKFFRQYSYELFITYAELELKK